MHKKQTPHEKKKNPYRPTKKKSTQCLLTKKQTKTTKKHSHSKHCLAPGSMFSHFVTVFSSVKFWPPVKMTLQETNIAPENRPDPKRKRESIPTIHFQVRTVSFRDGIFLVFQKSDVFCNKEFPQKNLSYFKIGNFKIHTLSRL